MKKIKWGKKDLPGDIRIKIENAPSRPAKSKKQIHVCPQESYLLINTLLKPLDTTLNANQ